MKTKLNVTILITLWHLLSVITACYQDDRTCDERVFDHDSFVCVCDADYCDFIGTVPHPTEEGLFKRIISSRDNYRFSVFNGAEDVNAKGTVNIKINYDEKYQEIFGFGGAFTDSTGIAYVSLSDGAQNNLIKSYFAKEGIEYDLCRIPIAGTDFSTYPYSYDEVDGDVELKFWSLTKEDLIYKIPLIKKAKELSEKEILFFGSPWSPPPWMKENGKHNGTGGLLKEMWEPFSNYLLKFVRAYENHGISLWGLTTTNEPLAGFEDWSFNACAWSAEDMRDWIKTSFGPLLEKENLRRLKIMVGDSPRNAFPWYPAKILEDPIANNYVDGVTVHWYRDKDISANVLTELVNEFPNKFLMYSEACEGWYDDPKGKVHLGSWKRAESYANNILEDVNHNSTAWVDWNMALDTQGGPNWVNNFVDAPIIVNAEKNEFYKQPMFYAIGHFSKFVVRGSRRLELNIESNFEDIAAAAFLTPGGTGVIVILNKGEKEIPISFNSNSGKYINFSLNPKSLETVLLSRREE